MTTILVESESHAIDFNILYLQCIPNEFHQWIGGSELPFLPNFLAHNFVDIIFKVEDKLFKCHKVFFCGRSDYFKALINDHFLEAQHQIDGIQVFEIFDISINTFIGIISYMYQNQVQVIFSQSNHRFISVDKPKLFFSSISKMHMKC